MDRRAPGGGAPDGRGFLEAELSRPLAAAAGSIVGRLRRAAGVLVALDFDGTLAPVASRPEDAKLPAETAAVLRGLAATDSVELAIVSGRSVDDLRASAGIDAGIDAIWAGNHGLEIEGRGIRFRHAEAEALRGTIEQACRALEERFESVRGVVVERKGLSATVHYRHGPSDLETWIAATVRHAMWPYAAWVRVSRGLKAWEIRPRVDWNKGSVLAFLLDRLELPGAAVVCAGDDFTDEDMFVRVPEAISIRVGARRRTAARFHAAGPRELAAFLARLRTALCEWRAERYTDLRCLPEEGGRPSV